jgi:hypothetical protein
MYPSRIPTSTPLPWPRADCRASTATWRSPTARTSTACEVVPRLGPSPETLPVALAPVVGPRVAQPGGDVELELGVEPRHDRLEVATVRGLDPLADGGDVRGLGISHRGLRCPRAHGPPRSPHRNWDGGRDGRSATLSGSLVPVIAHRAPGPIGTPPGAPRRGRPASSAASPPSASRAACASGSRRRRTASLSRPCAAP